MSEDIIARLTQNADDFCNCPLCIKTVNTMQDAAKEIERLRTELKESQDYASDLWMQRQRGDWAAHHD